MGELQWTEYLKLAFLEILNSEHKASFSAGSHMALAIDIMDGRGLSNKEYC